MTVPFFSKLERMIAMRYLKSSQKKGVISVIAGFSFIGIMLGVATLIVVMAVMNGFRDEITSNILGTNGHINVSAYGGGIHNFDDLSRTIEALPHITSAIPVINEQVMASTDFSTLGAGVQGIRLRDLQEKSIISDHIVRGDLLAFHDEDSIMLGVHLATQLGVTVGDQVTLLAPSGNVTAIGTLPRLKRYNVAALFEVGMYDYDSRMIFMPFGSAQLFFRLRDGAGTIEVVTDDPYSTSDITGSIIHAITKFSDVRYQVADWQMVNSGLFNALKIERTMLFLILTLIVIVAAFNIVSSLIMLVNDKRKDIAVLRTMGASRAMILRIFFMCGATIGMVGTLLGLILGIVFATNIESIRQAVESLLNQTLFDQQLYLLTELPSKINPEDVLMAILVGVVCSLVATIYPAWKASTQDPVEVLRYE